MTTVQGLSVTIVGAGFTGLAAGYDLAKRGASVTVLESDSNVGGLASAFDVGGEKIERFYHHWFTNDREIMDLIAELGLDDGLQINATNTGLYYANSFFKLSTPSDLLRFTALPFVDRIRLGLLTLRARRVEDWMALEDKSAREWLIELGGDNVYRVVWEPLLKGKFGPYADDISAVWFWNKLKLRGSSRGNGGEERLAYLKGGFAVLAETMAQAIRNHGGRVEVDTPVTAIRPCAGRWQTVTARGVVESDSVIATPALPLVAGMVRSWADDDYLRQLERIHYLANVCLVLELDRALSSTYWLNVNDPSFPFVGVIEHTNFERAETYGGRHIVYLSKYLPDTDPVYLMSKDELLEYALPYLQRMFPAMRRDWVQQHHLWRARWAQPVVEKHYAALIPATSGPLPGFYVCSMAQIYPEDRGTNYAIREGRRLARQLLRSGSQSTTRASEAAAAAQLH